MPENIHYDHEALEATAKQLETVGDRIESGARPLVDKIIEAFVQQASLNTRDQAPAPIYGELIEQAKRFGDAMNKRLTEVKDTLHKDAESIRKSSAEAQGIADDAAAGINKEDGDIDRTGAGSAGTGAASEATDGEKGASGSQSTAGSESGAEAGAGAGAPDGSADTSGTSGIDAP